MNPSRKRIIYFYEALVAKPRRSADTLTIDQQGHLFKYTRKLGITLPDNQVKIRS